MGQPAQLPGSPHSDHRNRLGHSYTNERGILIHCIYSTSYTLFTDLLLQKTLVHYPTLHYTLHYTTLHYTTLHYTTLHYTTLHYTTLHYTTLHYTTLHHTTPHLPIFIIPHIYIAVNGEPCPPDLGKHSHGAVALHLCWLQSRNCSRIN